MCNYLLHNLFLENAINLGRSNEAKLSKTGNSLRGQKNATPTNEDLGQTSNWSKLEAACIFSCSPAYDLRSSCFFKNASPCLLPFLFLFLNSTPLFSYRVRSPFLNCYFSCCYAPFLHITLFVKQKLQLQDKMAEYFSFVCLFLFFCFWHVACADVYHRACRLWKSQCSKTKYYNMRTFLETMCPLTCGQCRISSFAGTHAH